MKRIVQFIVATYVLIILLMLISAVAMRCQAQAIPRPGIAYIPDCCSQALDLSRTLSRTRDSLTNARTVLDSTRIVGDRIIRQTDWRIADITEQGNERIRTLSAQINDLRTSQADYQSVKQERDTLKGRTWAGRMLRKARDGLAIVGSYTVVVLILKTIL